MPDHHPLQAYRCVHLLDDRNPPVAAGLAVYTVCGLVMPPLEPQAGPPAIEADRSPRAATCPACTGPLGYTWYRVVATVCDIDIEGGVWRTPEEAWDAFFAVVHAHGVSVGYEMVRATTRRAAAEARKPWGYPPQRKRIGRGRWQRYRWWPKALIVIDD